MGEVISKRAGRDKIIEDTKKTMTGAEARASGPVVGALWGTAAGRLMPFVQLFEATAAKLATARAELAPLAAAVAVANDGADDVLKVANDEIWNVLGRPGNDPAYELMFPGGSAFYADAGIEEQPDLMLLLAEILESNVHPRLGTEGAPRAAKIRAAGQVLAAANDAARRPAAQVRLYDRMLTMVARAAQVELSKFKRYLKSEGVSEADIHAVIPDRPRDYGTGPSDVVTPVQPAPLEPVVA